MYEQMKNTMDAMFTNRTDLTLGWLIENKLRPDYFIVPSAEDVLLKLGY